MGYRHYVYSIPKELAKQIYECKTHSDFVNLVKNIPIVHDDEDDYVALYKLGKEIYNFGKYYEAADKIYKKATPMFENSELQNQYSDYRPYIIDKNGFLEAIKWQKEHITNAYKNLLQETSDDWWDKDRTQFDRMKSWIKDYYFWWSHNYCLNMKENDDNIVGSYLYEHTIFELVRIYKTFDWDNNVMLFMGW